SSRAPRPKPTTATAFLWGRFLGTDSRRFGAAQGPPRKGAATTEAEVGSLAPGLVPGQEYAVGKRAGLDQVQVHPVVQGREERRAAAHQNRVGDDRVLVDQPGPHGR